MLKTRITGVLCEVEFAELYDGQPIFCDTQNFLRRDHFRLCEIYSHQYLNTAPLPQEIQGKGFLTVGEALFLREGEVWIGGKNADSIPKTPIQNIIQTLKLAAIAVAFDQLDYALGLCRRLEEKKLVSLDRLADQSNVKYVKLLRDLCRTADLIQAKVGPPPLEPTDIFRKEKATKLRQKLPLAFGLIIFIVRAVFQKLTGKILKSDFVANDSLIGKIMYEYGLNESATSHARRTVNYRRLKYLYVRAWEALFS